MARAGETIVTGSPSEEQRDGPSLPILGLPGIGPGRAQAYAAAGLHCGRDLLYHLPNRYRLRPAPVTAAELVHGERAAVWGTVERASARRRGRNSTVSVLLRDATGAELLVLIFNRAYLAKALPKGSRLWAAGKAEVPDEGRPRLLAADHERFGPLSEEDPTGEEPTAGGCHARASADPGPAPVAQVLPLYRLPVGVPPRVHRKAVAAVLAAGGIEDWREPAPGEPSLAQALATLHEPPDRASLAPARQRLARDEAMALSLDVAARRRDERPERGVALALDQGRHTDLLACLPHQPTAAQRRVLDELRADLSAERPMARLLQGDVGSGKTMIALYALLAAVGVGRQAALMAPTEVLAVQHARELERLLHERLGDNAPEVALVAGAPRGPGSARARRRLREGLADGSIPLAVGTHGLASKTLTFHDLAVVVVDEQQRFGVRQRVRLRTKGPTSHLLVMTATPIPRTLALTAYGELDVSLLDELPPGRSPRTTRFVPTGKHDGLWRHLAAEVAAGRRGYVVCPSIDAGEEEGHSVEETLGVVRARLGSRVRVGAVHGRLPSDERDAVLDAFRAGALDVLVATVLIEVGLDVPEATFVVLPAPARFGLATLHQIRGRVGRGSHPGSCWLLGPVKGEVARDRIRALCESEDGFALAEQDLQLRGPGEVLGTRQSGMPGFLVLDPVADVELLAATRADVLARAAGLGEREIAALRERAFPRLALVQENLLAGG